MSKNKPEENIEVINLHKNHRKRMDERFKRTGFCGWSEYEVLEYMLYAVIKRGDTSPMSHELLHKYGNLHNVINASMDELMQIDGIGKESARHLSVLKAFSEYISMLNNDIPRRFDLSAENTISYIKQQFYGLKSEVFIMICLDAANRLIKTETLFTGTFNRTDINITTVTRAAVGCNAAKVIFAHNHPSGNPIPSSDDMRTTDWLTSALTACGIAVIEHVIIAGNNVSLVKRYMQTGELYEDKKKTIKMRSYNRQK